MTVAWMRLAMSARMREPLPPMSAHFTFARSAPFFISPPMVMTWVMSPWELMPTVTSSFSKSCQESMMSALATTTREVWT